MRRGLIALVILLLLHVVPALTLAQSALDGRFGSYTRTGANLSLTSPPFDLFKDGIERALWRIGPLRLTPILEVRNVSYVARVAVSDSQQTSDKGDLTATGGVGIRGYLRNGSKILWSTFARSDYVWWRSFEEKRRLNLSYGGVVEGKFNRLRLSLAANSLREQRYVSSELEQPIDVATDSLSFSSNLKLSGRLSAYAAARVGRTRNSDSLSPDLDRDVRRLNRSQWSVGGGVAAEIRRWLRLRIGLARSGADFDLSEGDRSNTRTSFLLGVNLGDTASPFSLALSLALGGYSAGARSVAVSSMPVTGTLRARWKPGHRFVFGFQARYAFLYSVRSADGTFASRRVRFLATAPLGRRLFPGLFVEAGWDDLTSALLDASQPGSGDSLERYYAVGGELRFAVVENLQLGIVGIVEDHDSYRDEGDRLVTRVAATVSFRLNFGPLGVSGFADSGSVGF